MTGNFVRLHLFFHHASRGLSCRDGSAAQRTFTPLRLEQLEERALLSATTLPTAQGEGVFQPQVTVLAAPPGQTANPSAFPTGYGYSPSQLQTAYGFNQISFLKSSTNPNYYDQNAGKGETIAIVDAYNDPTIVSDANTFSNAAGLTPFNGTGDPTLTVINQTGGSSLPMTSRGWSTEIALDVEWAHAIAPQANIVLVEANSNSISDLFTAVGTAASKAPVVSMSWGGGEYPGIQNSDSVFTQHPKVTFVAASGDYGMVSYPATSPDVVAVGGTTLHLTGSNTRSSETGWGNGTATMFLGGSGGGYSMVESEPSYQKLSYTTSVTSNGYRMGPDVSYDADPATGFAIYDTTGATGWTGVGGTSAGAPQWSALFALADQGRGSAGPLGYSSSLGALYTMAGKAYSTYFNDITTGNNGHSAGTGYDLVTGLGSPVANNIVNYLVNDVSSGSGGGGGGGNGGGGGGGGGLGTPPPPTGQNPTPPPPAIAARAVLASDGTVTLVDPVSLGQLGTSVQQLETELQSQRTSPIIAHFNLVAELQMDSATLLVSLLQNSDAYLNALDAMSGHQAKQDF